jgi:hypothetical protein
MRYIVVPHTFDKIHPLWPNEQVFFIKDLTTGRTSFSCYTKIEVAEEICKKKNL